MNRRNLIVGAGAAAIAAPTKAEVGPSMSATSVLQDDLRDLCRALGMADVARPQSPHQVFRECLALVEGYRDALERIALLDEADGHELTWRHASRAVGTASQVLGKHPAEIFSDRERRKGR